MVANDNPWRVMMDGMLIMTNGLLAQLDANMAIIVVRKGSRRSFNAQCLRDAGPPFRMMLSRS
jgi:hypothetical protein